MEREKGQDVASMSCPNCGGETPLVAMPDGGVAQATCPNCYGGEALKEAARAVAAAERPAQQRREKSTPVSEVPSQEESS